MGEAEGAIARFEHRICPLGSTKKTVWALIREEGGEAVVQACWRYGKEGG